MGEYQGLKFGQSVAGRRLCIACCLQLAKRKVRNRGQSTIRVKMAKKARRGVANASEASAQTLSTHEGALAPVKAGLALAKSGRRRTRQQQRKQPAQNQQSRTRLRAAGGTRNPSHARALLMLGAVAHGA